jgi:peptide/nickel transport system permease protein
MLRYIALKFIAMIPLLLAVSIISFGLIGLLELKGNVAEEILGVGAADPAAVAEVEAALGLDDPLPVRYLKWLGNALQGDLGDSLSKPGTPVTRVINERIWPTLSIVALSMALGAAFGILFGILSAIKPGSRLDRTLTVVSASMLATPGFVLAMLMVMLFSVRLGWFDPTGYSWPGQDGWFAWLKSITLPAVALSLPMIAIVQRQLRSSMSAALQSRYVLAARARGIPAGTIIRRHAVRNAMIPTVTVMGFQASNAIGLTIAVEAIFAIPGTGSLLTQAINSRDITVVQGTLMIAAGIVAVVNLLVDLSYGWLNPKVRYE